MRLKNIVDDDSAVSPVIGVILMVAITVILAAVIASFVLGLGPSESAPQAQFDFEVDNNGATPNVTISHQSGASIDNSTLSIQGDLDGTDSVDWSDSVGNPILSKSTSEEITSGDSVELNTSSADWELTLVWESGDQSSELASDSA
jgi:flagellin-like protein